MADYDLVVIGSGVGGYPCAIRAAQLGLKAAIVEKRPKLGGTCLNVGCIPSKALLESSDLYYGVRHRLSEHGISCGDVDLDLGTLMERKQKIVTELVDGVGLLMKKNKVKVFNGRGVLVGPHKVTVEGEDGTTDLDTKAVCLAMGSAPVELPFAPFDGKQIISSKEALELEEVPEHLVVIGAGAVGLELGSVWSRFGAKVTVIEMLDRIAPFADKQMSNALQRALEEQGLEFRLSTKVTDISKLKKNLKIALEDKDGAADEIRGDMVLVAVGRRAVIEGGGLEEAGVELEDGKRVKVDEHFRTNLQDVYAVGDLIRGPMLAHKAEDEGMAVAELVAGKPGHVNYDAIPNVVYTEPELAMVGKTAEELKEAGVPVATGRFPFKINGRAKGLGLTDGMVKILAHKETDQVLGVHIVGPRASELIAEATVAMEFSSSSEDLARTCHPHPTLSEAIREAALAVDKRSINS